MLRYLLQRLLVLIPTFLGITLLTFSLIRLIPGDPVEVMVGERSLDPEMHAAALKRLGLDQPLYVQYGRYLADLAQGNLGQSLKTQASVWSEFKSLFPATLELALVALLIALVFGLIAGVLAAVQRGKWLDHTVMTAALTGYSMPIFWWGLLLILVFSVGLGWLPAFGRGELVQLGGWSTGLLSRSGWASLLMPAVTLALFQLTLFMRLTRTQMMEVMRSEYIKFARARGLRERSVHFKHALRNTLIPIITVAGLQIGAMIAFSIITETVFQWPGLGLLIIQAITFSDVPVIAAYLLLIALLFVLINTVVDLLYFAVDPRLRTTR